MEEIRQNYIDAGKIRYNEESIDIGQIDLLIATRSCERLVVKYRLKGVGRFQFL